MAKKDEYFWTRQLIICGGILLIVVVIPIIVLGIKHFVGEY